MSEMDNAKGIFEKSSADQNDEHEFKIFQSYALKYKMDESRDSDRIGWQSGTGKVV
jgi:hypothetical protein